MPKTIENYIRATKPWIVLGNLVTATAGFFLAAKGRIAISVLFPMLVGISMVVGSACVLNNCIDRNIDRQMHRTRNRVLARGLITPKAAVLYAFLLGVMGMIILLATTNPLVSAIILAGFVMYVCVYTLYLKRRSIYGTLIGSLAGVAPPLAGYCAVSNRFDIAAMMLLAIFSLWQVPHSYASVIYRYNDYTASRIPALPVKCGILTAKNHIVGFITVFMAASLLPTFIGYAGYFYLTAAVLTSLAWLSLALAGYWVSNETLWAKNLFTLSILVIFVLSVMMSIDFVHAIQ